MLQRSVHVTCTKKRMATEIKFGLADLARVRTPHDDPLVITLNFQRVNVCRVLLDGGSSAYVLFWQTFKRMRLNESNMLPSGMPLVGFERMKIVPKGSIILEVYAAGKTLGVDFIVIDAPSSYNATMARGWIYRMEGVVSTFH